MVVAMKGKLLNFSKIKKEVTTSLMDYSGLKKEQMQSDCWSGPVQTDTASNNG